MSDTVDDLDKAVKKALKKAAKKAAKKAIEKAAKKTEPDATTVTKKPRRASGDGSLYYSKSEGLWTAKVELTPDPITGDRRWTKVRRKKKEDARTELEAMQDRIKAGADIGRNPTVAEWVWYWYEEVDESRPTTRAGLRTKISQYIIPALGKKKVTALVPDDMRKLRNYIVDTKGLSVDTARVAHAVLQSALAAAITSRIITYNPAQAAKKPKLPHKVQPTLNVQGVKQVLKTVSGERLAARWALALLYGARQGEVIGMELDRIDWNRGTIQLDWQLQRLLWRHGCRPTEKEEIRCGRKRGTDCPDRTHDMDPSHEYRHLTGGLWHGRPKTTAGNRSIPLVEPLYSTLADRAEAARAEPNPHGLLFTAPGKQVRNTNRFDPLDGRPIDPSDDSKAWHDVLKRAGFERMKLHSARHTTVSVLNALEVPESVIIKIVGQSSKDMSRHYDDNRDDAPSRRALGAVGNLFADIPELSRQHTPAVSVYDDSEDPLWDKFD